MDADPNTGTWHLPTFSFDYLSLPAVSRDRHTDGENDLFVDGHATRDHVKTMLRAQFRLDIDTNNATTGISAYYKD